MTRLFGTDGIRDRALEGHLAPAAVERLGRILAGMLAEPPSGGAVLIGRDTRASGPAIEDALVRGLSGVRVLRAGVITTPGVAHLARKWGCRLGVSVTASHNPAEDNGIKLLSSRGLKIPDEMEREIEARMGGAAAGGSGGDAEDASSRAGEYADDLRAAAGSPDLAGLRLVVDCANGATSPWARRVFEPLGAQVRAIHASPDGRNINAGCGAVHVESLASAVRESGADLGVAFDGDGDRAMFVDAAGEVRDGDDVLWISAAKSGGVLVSTVMANYGLERALADRGVRLVRTAVGDRYVAEAMEKEGAKIGGEPSGHVIFREYGPTGDGMLTALVVMKALREGGTTLAQAAAGWTRYPQMLLNVRVREKRPLEEVPAVAAAVRAAVAEMGRDGRVLVRYSGTEPVCRVMVEGRDGAAVNRLAQSIRAAVAREVGGW